MVNPASVLITGGSGFFGRAFVESSLKRGVPRICIFSRGEARQAAMRAELGDPAQCRWFIGDVRDLSRLTQAMEGVELVIHAAALKRVEVCEYDVSEVVKTNVVGTLNVVEAATAAKLAIGTLWAHATTLTRKVIGISSDKAAAPINAYGATKLVMEKILLAANNARGANGPIYAVCRYGNVWGSTGSIVPTWRALIARGFDTMPVTSPDATRFFMTREQAVNLVWDTAEIMKGGELIVPELPAYCLGDLAEAMQVKMNLTGLPKHEKMHETMGGADSSHVRRMSVAELREALKNV